MTIRATGGFGLLHYDPGNPQFPTLPDGIAVAHPLTYPDGGGNRRYANATRGYYTKLVKTSAPANDRQRFAGWQTETTWVNPAIVDFGVIPSPVRRTVSLYNARSTPVEVTALSLPTGVTLVSPSLPLTLNPYDGDTFTLEASTTGDNAFDEFHIFTTSEGDVSFRLLGRRVFTINVIPQRPMRETLLFRTDLIRSTDGTEKVYGLMQAPTAEVDYHVKFTNDLERIRFKNGFIAGASALVVAGQKWFEARALKNVAASIDTTLDVDVDVIDASWVVGGPISVVTEEGVAVSAQLDSYQFQPDANVDLNVLVLRFEDMTDSSQYDNTLTFEGVGNPSLSSAQSKFGGQSYFGGTTFPAFAYVALEATYDPAMDFGADDWTVDFWIRPHAEDLTGCVPISRWNTLKGGRQWRFTIRTNDCFIQTASPAQTMFFTYGSPRPFTLDTWSYVRLVRVGDVIKVFVDGVQIDIGIALVGSILTSGSGSPSLPTQIGDYYDSGFTNPVKGYIDDVRITVGIARDGGEDFTPPTEQHSIESEQYLEFTLGSELGIDAPAGSKVMPVGLGYVSQFPRYLTHAKNLEEAKYRLAFNQETDFSALDSSFVTLTDLQSPENTLPILEFCNEIRGAGKQSRVERVEYDLASGLSNRIAFSKFPFADNVSEFRMTLYSGAEVWKWRTFLHYLRGSYGEFFVPTFTNDIPGVTTAASNVFNADDTDLALLFGNPPDPRRNALRFLYPDGTILYRMITQVIDNVATEEITVNSSVDAGNPEIGYLQRARILGDTANFTHTREGDVELTFRFRTVLL